MKLALPIRVRLTLWYTLAIAVTLFTIGFIALWMVHHAIDDLERNELQQRVHGINRYLDSRPQDLDPAQFQEELTSTFETVHGYKWLQIIDEHGNWLYRAPHVAARFPTLELPQTLAENGYFFTYTAEGIPVRGLIIPIQARGVRYTVQMGLTLSKTLEELLNFKIQLFFLISVGLLFSSIAGHLMSRKALEPVAALTRKARLIHERNLGERLPMPGARDEIRRLAETLNQMLERIDRAFSSIKAITGNASHELRTPVTLMRTEIEVALLTRRSEQEYRKTLENLLEETVRMTDLVENLLALARADGGAESLKLAPIPVHQLFAQTAKSWQQSMQQAGLNFKVVYLESDVRVLADMRALDRLLSILLENASKYTPAGGNVILRANVQAGRVEIAVEDTGIGIPAEYQGKVFERFFRAPNGDEILQRGSGLGLALAKWIAERHSTTVTLISGHGNGSRFSFLLPIVQSEA